MIDYEIQIFNEFHSAVEPFCEANRIVSTPISNYTSLPACSLYEMNNNTVQRRQSSTPVENFARITYQLDIAANSKAQCRKIFIAADNRMISMNFTRINGNYITYQDNKSVVRYAAKYEALIDQEGNLYRVSS